MDPDPDKQDVADDNEWLSEQVHLRHRAADQSRANRRYPPTSAV